MRIVCPSSRLDTLQTGDDKAAAVRKQASTQAFPTQDLGLTNAARSGKTVTCSSIWLSVVLCWSSKILSIDELNLQGEGRSRSRVTSLRPKYRWLCAVSPPNQ